MNQILLFFFLQVALSLLSWDFSIIFPIHFQDTIEQIFNLHPDIILIIRIPSHYLFAIFCFDDFCCLQAEAFFTLIDQFAQ